MFDLDDTARADFRQAVTGAAARADVRDAIRNLYHALQEQIELRRPICVTSGRCCRFDDYGHRLFVTTMELATFFHELSATSAYGFGGTSAMTCPFQRDKLCTVHSMRPFGCRIFFCDETSTDWQRSQYESFHAELKRLHGRFEVPYFYIEWRQALGALGGSGNAANSNCSVNPVAYGNSTLTETTSG